MGTLRDQLADKVPGLRKTAERLEAQERRRNKRVLKKQVFATASPTEELEKCCTRQQFRAVAQRALLGGKVSIREIIRIAHDPFKGKIEAPKFNHFIQFFLRLRETLDETAKKKHKAVIRKMFRQEFK